jgi:hypothetical protein
VLLLVSAWVRSIVDELRAAVASVLPITSTAATCSAAWVCSGRGRPLPKLSDECVCPFELELQLNIPRFRCLASYSLALQLTVECHALLLFIRGQLCSSSRR